MNAGDDATAPVLLHSIFQPSGSSHIPTLHGSMQDTANATRNKASALQDLVDKVVQGGLSEEDITLRCQMLGVSLVEFKDVLAEAEHYKRVRFGKSRVDDDLEDAGSSPDLLDFFEHNDNAQPVSIPAFVLAGAPHLASTSLLAMDNLIQESVNLRRLFSTDKIVNSVVSVLRLRSMPDPLPTTIWKLIICDEYVDFEKLHAGLDPLYDQNNNIRRLQGDYSIVKMDSIFTKKKIVSETELSQVYQAWSSSVTAVYLHCSKELEEYKAIISEIFHLWANRPTVAIETNAAVQKNYAKSPFRLDV
ncbi:hypothetical protein PHLCEN_2v2015, partial [Hermanssonia centrifuga]